MLKLALGALAARVVALDGFKQPDRESLVPGDYIPGEATTGSYGELLKRVGNLTTTKDGEVFEGLYIEGQITINHSVTFKRCHIKGATPTAASYAVVRCYKAIAKPAPNSIRRAARYFSNEFVAPASLSESKRREVFVPELSTKATPAKNIPNPNCRNVSPVANRRRVIIDATILRDSTCVRTHRSPNAALGI